MILFSLEKEIFDDFYVFDLFVPTQFHFHLSKSLLKDGQLIKNVSSFSKHLFNSSMEFS